MTIPVINVCFIEIFYKSLTVKPFVQRVAVCLEEMSAL